MLESPLAPYLLWAKQREPAPFDLAGSNLLHCTMADLPGARDAVDLGAPNDDGYAPLVDRIAAHHGVAREQVVTASGCSGANFLTIAATVAGGDDVLIERPTYDPIVGACRLMGARIRHFDRRHETGWRLDLDHIARQLTPRTRLIALTRPHNPSGMLVDADDLQALGRLALDAAAHVLVDEVYLDATLMLRAGAPREPAATLDGPFISTGSLTKSYGLAGLRAGWAISSRNMAERLRRTRDVIDNASSAPADLLAAHAFQSLPRLAERARALLTANVALARAFFERHPELELAVPPAGSIVFPRLSGSVDAGPFVAHLREAHGVAVAPGHFFDAPAHFRVSLAGRTDQLAGGLERIARALGDRV
jgi:hypothetical protein